MQHPRAVFGAHAEPRLMESNTEPTSPSPPPAPERTNSQFKHANRKRAQFSTRARRETRLKVLEHCIYLFLLLYRQIQNDVKIPVLESILEKAVGYGNNQLRQKSDVSHYIGCIVSKIDHTLLAAVSVLNGNPRKCKKEYLLLTELLCSFNNN